MCRHAQRVMRSPHFPALGDDVMRRLLAPPRAPIRVVIDTDARNEIDDQYALTWALLAPDVLELEAVYAAPFSYVAHRDGLMQAFEVLSASPDRVPELGRLARYASWARALIAAGLNPRDLPIHGPEVG